MQRIYVACRVYCSAHRQKDSLHGEVLKSVQAGIDPVLVAVVALPRDGIVCAPCRTYLDRSIDGLREHESIAVM